MGLLSGGRMQPHEPCYIVILFGLDHANLVHCIVVPVVHGPRSRAALSVPATAKAKP